MPEQQVSLQELESKLDRYTHDVENGATVVVSPDGRQVARIIPGADSAEQKRAALKASGAFDWSGRRPEEQKAVGPAPGRRQRERHHHQRAQMMFLYLDSSALVKRYIDEAHSEAVAYLLDETVAIAPDAASLRFLTNPKRSPESLACAQWLRRSSAAGETQRRTASRTALGRRGVKGGHPDRPARPGGHSPQALRERHELPRRHGRRGLRLPPPPRRPQDQIAPPLLVDCSPVVPLRTRPPHRRAAPEHRRAGKTRTELHR